MSEKPKVCPTCGGDASPKGRLTHEQLLTPEQAQAHAAARRKS